MPPTCCRASRRARSLLLRLPRRAPTTSTPSTPARRPPAPRRRRRVDAQPRRDPVSACVSATPGIVGQRAAGGEPGARRASTSPSARRRRRGSSATGSGAASRCSANWNYTLYRRAPSGREEDIVERCWTVGGGCAGSATRNVAGPPTSAQAGSTSRRSCCTSTATRARCAAAGPPTSTSTACRSTSRDRIDPTFAGTPSGDLLDTTQPLTGVRSVSFSASDQGGGVYSGAARGRRAGGGVRRSSTTTAAAASKPFRDLVPCKRDGVRDAVPGHGDAGRRGAQRPARGHRRDRDQHRGLRAGAGDDGEPVDRVRAGTAAELTARFATTRRTAMTRRGGRRVHAHRDADRRDARGARSCC